MIWVSVHDHFQGPTNSKRKCSGQEFRGALREQGVHQIMEKQWMTDLSNKRPKAIVQVNRLKETREKYCLC